MKLNFLRGCWLALAVIVSPAIQAAELNLNSFLGSNPLKGLDVELDGNIVGVTGDQGELSAPLKGGTHVLRLLKKSAQLANYSFAVAEGESADLSIAFTDFEQPPQIAFDKYDASATAGGAKGVIEGYVTDPDGFALAGATVRLDESGAEVLSAETGAFRLEVPRGLYTLSASHPDYETATPAKVRIIANVGIGATVALRPKVTEAAGVEEFSGSLDPSAPGDAPAAGGTTTEVTTGADGVQEIVVVGTFRPAALQTTADRERFSAAVTDAISVDDLLRFGDSDIAASLKRIVGISVSEGKYAVVRGLDGRYISSTLNGALLPSTDPFRRDVQLDLFPPNILGGIEIQKNFSADLPGETTGGIIKLVTRNPPEEYVNEFSGSIGYISDVTGRNLSTYEGSDTDAFGFDDGLRELPGSINSATNGGLRFNVCQVADQPNCVQPEAAAALGASLPNIYNPERESAPPDFGLSYTLGNTFERDAGSIGLYGTASYDQESASRQDAFIFDPAIDSRYRRDERTVAFNSYFVAGFESIKGWQVRSKTILLRDSEDTVEVESGLFRNDDITFDEVLLEYVERQLLAQQFEGSVGLFNDRHKFNWRAGLSQTTRDSPDRRSYLYQGGFLAISSVERSYSELTEDGLDLGFDYSIPVELTDTILTDVSFGALLNAREREVDLVRIGVRQGPNPILLTDDLETLLSAENFANGAFQLNARSTATDSYDAEQDSIAYFVSSETEFGSQFTLVAGLRIDDFSQDLSFPNSDNATAGLESNEALPALSLIYRPREDIQLRFAYAGTVSRPNITELAPSRFFDERGREFIGCPTCEASTVDNFDLRAEYYFNDKDSASIALFTKEIDQPLERSVADGSGSASDALTFRNNRSASISGIELDAYRTFLSTEAHGLALGANMAFIESDIELDDVGQRLEISDNRDLQGQSPFLANLQLSHDYFPWRQKATLLANYFDDRIDIVTRNQPSIIETGRLQLNFNYEKELFSSSKLSLKLKNILDEDIEYTQGGRTIERYKEGAEISLGYSLRFN